MHAKKQQRINYRALVLMSVFFLLFAGCLIRFLYIQTATKVNGQDLQAMAEARWYTERVLEGKRGTIYDRSGSAIAEEINSYTVFAVLDKGYPDHVEDPQMTAAKLSPILDVSVDYLEDRLTAEGLFQVELGPSAQNISHEKKQQIEALDLPGINFNDEPRRYYRKQNYASHVIGYTERDMSQARMGLESSLNDLLEPEDGYVRYRRDRAGIKLPDPNETIQAPKSGHEVYLTLDSNIQTALEQVMSQVEVEYEPERIMAVVADPKTGAILAMSNRPSFNPNHYESITNYQNFTVSSRFEPGSTMKVFTLAAAIEEGVYDGEDTYLSGSYVVGNHRISDHNRGRGWGEISYNEGVQRSSNVAFSKIALEQLGPEKLYEYLEHFGFTEPTGIDLPNEATGLIANQSPIDAATTSFGQGTAITPIQQIQAATAIANGGKMMRPYVIDRIVNSETGAVVEQTEPTVVGEPISSQTASKVLDLLETVVSSPAGTGKPYYIEGFQIAGKTGTAQIPKVDGRRGYMSGKGQNIFSFIGTAPKDDPRVIVYVAVDRPKLKPTESGSAPVAKVFNTIMKHSLQYLNITPTMQDIEEKAEEGGVMADYQGMEIDEAANQLRAQGVDVVMLGADSLVVDQVPVAQTRVLPGEKIMLRSDSKEVLMPEIEGWSRMDVMKLSEIMDLKPNVVGSGYVEKQSIAVGSQLRSGDYLGVELRDPLSSTDDDQTEEPGESPMMQ